MRKYICIFVYLLLRCWLLCCEFTAVSKSVCDRNLPQSLCNPSHYYIVVLQKQKQSATKRALSVKMGRKMCGYHSATVVEFQVNRPSLLQNTSKNGMKKATPRASVSI